MDFIYIEVFGFCKTETKILLILKSYNYIISVIKSETNVASDISVNFPVSM